MFVVLHAPRVGVALAVGCLTFALTVLPLDVTSSLEVTGKCAAAEPIVQGGRWDPTALERARERYRRAIGEPRRTAGHRAPSAVAELTAQETEALIATGWQTPGAGFRGHDERTRTMVELARRMGHDSRVGALQARFGTPYENGIAALDHEITRTGAKLGADPGNLDLMAELSRLDAERRDLIERVGPDGGEDRGWATVDLDVNRDGRVDRRDLVVLDRASPIRPAGYREAPAE